jgi:hypothetical protein
MLHIFMKKKFARDGKNDQEQYNAYPALFRDVDFVDGWPIGSPGNRALNPVCHW